MSRKSKFHAFKCQLSGKRLGNIAAEGSCLLRKHVICIEKIRKSDLSFLLVCLYVSLLKDDGCDLLRIILKSFIHCFAEKLNRMPCIKPLSAH